MTQRSNVDYLAPHLSLVSGVIVMQADGQMGKYTSAHIYIYRDETNMSETYLLSFFYGLHALNL